MNLSERIWLRVSKDRVARSSGVPAAEEGAPEGSTRDEPPTGRGHLTWDKDA